VDKYNKKDLERLILEQNKSYTAIGKLYNVSGNAIKKAAKKLEISLPTRRKVNKNENFSHVGYRKDSLINKISDINFIFIINNSKGWKEIGEKLGYKSKVSSDVKDSIERRCSMLGVELKLIKSIGISSLTKDELFNKRKNWQSARSAIQKHARSVFFESNPSPSCANCGYLNHVEVAHIKAVSEFDGFTTIGEINLLSNLMGLCPNHHWEYDNK